MKLVASAVVLMVASTVAAQPANDLSDPTTTTLPATTEAQTPEWSFSASVTGYIVPDDRDYVQPTFTADRDWLHLEARYNYEALDSASLWVGYNFSIGDEVTLDFTPMAGVVFGELEAVAPGYEVTLSWWKLELYTEGELVFDTDNDDDFFYSWSELSFAPADWIRFGVVAQRTNTYESDFDIDRGLFIGFSFRQIDFTTYVFNPDDDPTFVLGVSLNF